MTSGVTRAGMRDPADFERFCAAALPQVYGYLLARCRDQSLAEELTAETFIAAVRAVHRAGGAELSVGWLIVVARRRLVDHWRREERRARRLRLLEIEGEPILDPWTEPFDVDLAVMALTSLGPHHRAALTLRYLDGLPVADVACELGRGFHATEALLQRARSALRRAYEEEVRAHA